MPNSIVNTVATSALSRRNARIQLEDTLKNSASARTLQDRQGKAALTNASASLSNAASNRMNARTNAQNAANDFALGQGELALKTQALENETALRQAGLEQDQQRINLDSTRVGMELEKLPYAIDAMKTRTENEKLSFASSVLDYELKAAMQEGNRERIGKIFALQDTMMDTKMMGGKAEQSLHKWALVGQYASGISEALNGNRPDLALSLQKQLLADAKDAGISLESIGFVNQPATGEFSDQWGMLSDVAVNSLEMRQKVLLETLKNRGNATNTILDIMKMQFSQDQETRKENRTAVNNFSDTVLPGVASMLGLDAMDNGFIDSGNEEEQEAWNGFRSELTNLVSDGDQLIFPVQQARELATNYTSRLQLIDSGASWADLGGTKVIASKTPLIIENGEYRYNDAEGEIDAVGWNSSWKNNIRPGLIRLANSENTDIIMKNLLNKSIPILDSAGDDGNKRVKIYAELTRTIEAIRLGLLKPNVSR